MSKLHLTVISTLCLALSSQVAFSASFTLTSHELEKNRFPAAQTLSSPYGFGCSGGNLAPSFNWSGAPAGTQSFALKIYDRDAPTGLGWIHWQVVNIPSSLHSLPAGITADNKNLPQGALQTRTDFGIPGYGGPCPPKGEMHRYEVTLTALRVDKLPGITAESTPALVGFITKANSLGEAHLQITQGR